MASHYVGLVFALRINITSWRRLVNSAFFVRNLKVVLLFYRIEYEPKAVGTYTVNVIFADKEIPTSPYKVKVEPNIDVSGVKVLGLEKGTDYHYNMRFIYAKICLFIIGGILMLNLLLIYWLLNYLILLVLNNFNTTDMLPVCS